MIKKKIAIFFMLLASIMMLAHSSFIHHHHHHKSFNFEISLHFEDDFEHAPCDIKEIHQNQLTENEQEISIDTSDDHNFPCHSHYDASSEFYFTLQNQSNVLKKTIDLKTSFFQGAILNELFTSLDSKKEHLKLVFFIPKKLKNESITLRGPPIA